MGKVKLKFLGISEVVGVDDISLLTLVDEGEQRQLIVTCDKTMSKQIQLRMMNRPELKLLYPEVMDALLQDYGIRQLEVDIVGHREGEYITQITNPSTGMSHPVRCSDGILFSLVHHCPLYITTQLMITQSVSYQPGSPKIALPINVLTDKMLQMSLDKAIELENYEMASNLRDELKRRHRHDDQDKKQ